MRQRLFSNSNTLFKKMFVLMSLSVFIPVALLGFLSYNRSKEQLESVSSQFLEDNLQLNAKQINNFFLNVERESEKMISSLELQKLLRKEPPASYKDEVDFIKRLTGVVTQLKGTYETYVLPMDITSYPNYAKLINFNKLEFRHFERAAEQQGKGVWFHDWDDTANKSNFLYVRAIRSSYYYEALGVIVIQIPDSLLREELAFPSSFRNYTLTMVDDMNLIISHPSSKQYGKAFTPDKGWASAGTVLQEEGWTLFATIPQRELTGHLDQIKNFTSWIVLGSLFAITLLLVLIVRKFTVPIKQLVSHMVKLRSGILTHFAYNPAQKDEIGQLVRGYNQMITGMSDLLETTKGMEAEKRQLELQTLNHQINPHFFYNTLDSIKWKAESAGEQHIAAMVTKLANLLRFSLNSGEEWTIAEREIDHARTYLDIELLRGNRSFQVFFQIDPTITKLKMIKLILQPIMENAVKHGINRLPEGTGKIRMTAKQQDGDLVFVIEDNGPGLPESYTLNLNERQPSSSEGGIGLRNVHKRLQLHFGQEYGIQIDASRSAGFRLIIRHPIK